MNEKAVNDPRKQFARFDRGFVFHKPEEESAERQIIESGEKIFDRTSYQEFGHRYSLQSIDNHRVKFMDFNRNSSKTQLKDLQSLVVIDNNFRNRLSSMQKQSVVKLNRLSPTKAIKKGQYPTKIIKPLMLNSRESSIEKETMQQSSSKQE